MTFVMLYQELIKGTGAVIPPPWEVAGTCIYHCVISLSLCTHSCTMQLICRFINTDPPSYTVYMKQLL